MNKTNVLTRLLIGALFAGAIYINLGCDDCDSAPSDSETEYFKLTNQFYPADTLYFYYSEERVLPYDYRARVFASEAWKSEYTFRLQMEDSTWVIIDSLPGLSIDHEVWAAPLGYSFFRKEAFYQYPEESFIYYYDTISKSIYFNQQVNLTAPLVRSIWEGECTEYKATIYEAELEIVDSIPFIEHAIWSKGNPIGDTEKIWTIDSIFDKDMNYLGTAAYDCLYDNTFTFALGNSLKLDLGTEYCPSLDQPLLDQGQDFVFQQYAIIDEPGQANPYVLITTPGNLFAPQRMYLLNYDQEKALISTTYDTDSIFLKINAQ